VLTDQPAQAARVLRSMGLTEIAETAAEASGLLAETPPEKVVAALVHDGVAVRGFTVEAPSLEDVFVSLTGRGFDVDR
jgi:ABC-2 type transport system ATP-binding protein